jgi:hypothetical protein
MKYVNLFLVVILSSAFAAQAFAGTSVLQLSSSGGSGIPDALKQEGGCVLYDGTAIDEVGDEIYVYGGGRGIYFQVEPDTTGSGVGFTVQTFACTSQDADSCKEKLFDSDHDGYPENSEFDGYSEGKRGIDKPTFIAGYLRFLVIATALGGDEPQLQICGVK